MLLIISLGVNIGLLLHGFWPKIALRKATGITSGWHAGPMKRHLGLSSEQAQLMESERRQALSKVQPLQDDLRRKRRELFVLLKKSDVRESELDSTLNEISRLQAAIEKLFVLHSLKVRSVFSPEQLRKYEGCLERGLCPGMMSESSCQPGEMSHRGQGPAGCAGMDGKKK
jgi:Spy/CpxP family protein refolding chaperone